MNCIPVPIRKWKTINWESHKVILAETVCQKSQGLQWISNLPLNTLMLFLDVIPGSFFHTRNCKFPIDIISLDKNFTVLEIWTAPVNRDRIGPLPSRSKYVLEAPAGWCRQQQIDLKSALVPFRV